MDQRLGKTPTSSPTARRSRQMFLTLAASLGFQNHKRDVKCAFLQGTWTSNMRTTATMTLGKLSQRNQFSTRSANQFPSCLESCNWSIISVFVRSRPCAVLSTLQKDGIIVLPLIFETLEAKKETLLVDFAGRKRRHSCPVSGMCC